MTGPRNASAFLRRPLQTACIVASCISFGGCLLIPKITRPGAPVPALYPASGADVGGVAADIEWREFFKEPRLRRLLEIALENNRDLRRAVLQVEKSRAQYRVTRSSLLPSADARAEMTRSETRDIVSERWGVSTGISAYEVDLFGRIRSLSKQALEVYFATEEGRRSAQITLVAEVAARYFGLRQAEEQLALARETLAAVEQLYLLNKATFEAGATNELNLRTSEGQVQNVLVSVLTYEREVAQARNGLVLLMGVELPGSLPPPKDFLDAGVLAKVPAGLTSELLQRRPDILQAEHELYAANANVGAARAAFFPQIRLTASLGSSSDELVKLFGNGNGLWSFSPQVTLPIFTGGRNIANLEAAKIEVKIRVADYEKAVQVAFREVSDALVATNTYLEQAAVQRAAIGVQKRRMELADARFRQGEDAYLNVLSAQQDLYSVRQGHLSAQYNQIASQIALYKALGGGWK